MIRHGDEGQLHFPRVEALLQDARPARMAAERRRALLSSISANLGSQDQSAPSPRLAPQWILVPATVASVAAIIVVSQSFDSILEGSSTTDAHVEAPTVGDSLQPDLAPAQMVRVDASNPQQIQAGTADVTIQGDGDVHVVDSAGVAVVELVRGTVSFVSGDEVVRISGEVGRPPSAPTKHSSPGPARHLLPWMSLPAMLRSRPRVRYAP